MGRVANELPNFTKAMFLELNMDMQCFIEDLILFVACFPGFITYTKVVLHETLNSTKYLSKVQWKHGRYHALPNILHPCMKPFGRDGMGGNIIGWTSLSSIWIIAL
ncbi:hypothetical protein VNO77_19613 [Canavalia gladiata]|uniref:Uncharacterized protein n=1 Tax=Canavalia gladiata TaxID=3824 RepID=A0AAN9LSX1_CANGL